MPPDGSRFTPHGSRFTFHAPLLLQPTAHRREYRARFITAGTIRAQGNRDSNLTIPPETLQDAAGRQLFSGRPTFVDHASLWDNPSLHNMAGITLADAEWDEAEQGITGTIRLYETPAGEIVGGLLDQILSDAAAGEPVPDVGLSAVLWPRWRRIEQDDQDTLWAMSEIRHVESVDFVFEPGADGRIQQALTALQSLGQPADVDDTGHSPNLGAGGPRPRANPTERSNQTMPPEERTESEATPVQTVPSEQPWLSALRETAARAMIDASGLPAPSRGRLHSQAARFQSPAEVEDAIQAERDFLAAMVADDVVQVGNTPPRGSTITLGRDSMEQIAAAFEALIAGVTPPDGVRPLSGVREFYTLLSGDFEMQGVFQGDRVYLANVTCATMANLTANVLNKAVVNLFMEYPQWWAPLVSVEDFSTLQAVRWITLGGVGELPTVAEGAAYTELTWDDSYETASFVKKGGYLGITLEAIDKDDTNRVRMAPRALAQAAWLTLGKAVSNIFTDNSGTGPTMADTGALFNATAVSTTGGHANLRTTALSWSEWQAVRLAMMKQAEVNSSERLGFLTAPKYCLVPVDLEITALQILGSAGEPGTGDNDINPLADGDTRRELLRTARDRVVVVPHWTDTNNWAAVADPQLYPSIGLGFRYGRAPEIFSVASPTAGLMFSNDTMPVKVRFFFAVGPTDWRGLHKSNVS